MLFNLCLSVKLLFSPSILNEILAGRVFLGVDFSLAVLKLCPAIPFLPAEFLLKDQWFIVWGFPLCVTCCFFITAFNIFSLFLIFVSLIYVSQHVSPWVFPGLVSLCLLDLIDYFFPMLGKFSIIVFSKIFLDSFIFCSFSGIPIIQMLVLLILSKRPLRLSLVLSILFSLFCSLAVISSILSSSSLNLFFCY